MSYGVSEWMINYQGGFARRGLPGEVLLSIGRQTGFDIGLMVVILSLFLYLIYILIMARDSKGALPAWALWSAPLLGYPVYSDEIVRKDVLLLLFLIALLKVITRHGHGPLRHILIAVISSLALLSHELFFFFGLPLSIIADAIICLNNSKIKHMAHRALYWVMGWVPAAITAFFVFRFKGNDIQALAIFDSWTTLSPAGIEVENKLQGALSWFGKTLEDGIESTHRLLLATHLGFPFWLYVVLATTLAALVIAVMFTSVDSSRNFLLYFLAQAVFMGPIYFSALDTGRWIFITINSSLIYTLALDGLCLGRLSLIAQKWPRRLRLAISPMNSFIVLSIWGFPHYSWSIKGWLYGSPLFMLPTRAFFFMRSNNIIPDSF